jgi:hypothetical protein
VGALKDGPAVSISALEIHIFPAMRQRASPGIIRASYRGATAAQSNPGSPPLRIPQHPARTEQAVTAE